jgi:hypothetical protein
VSATAQLAQVLRKEGGLLADALRIGAPAADEPLIAGGANGPYALTLAAVREGYLLHYGESRVVDTADPDLALLGGDRLYALALARLAELGDLRAVAQLADLIACCAQAHAEEDPVQAESAWQVAASALAR